MKKIFLIILGVAILVGVGAFYGGMKYSEGGRRGQFSRSEFRGRFGGRQGGGNNFAGGEIIARDEKSITIKLRDGGSKIILHSDSTEIGKFVDGTSDDLEVGKNVMVNGEANSDGSITAQSIQLRPTLPNRQ